MIEREDVECGFFLAGFFLMFFSFFGMLMWGEIWSIGLFCSYIFFFISLWLSLSGCELTKKELEEIGFDSDKLENELDDEAWDRKGL